LNILSRTNLTTDGLPSVCAADNLSEEQAMENCCVLHT